MIANQLKMASAIMRIFRKKKRDFDSYQPKQSVLSEPNTYYQECFLKKAISRVSKQNYNLTLATLHHLLIPT
jgi:hypothetical protein